MGGRFLTAVGLAVALGAACAPAPRWELIGAVPPPPPADLTVETAGRLAALSCPSVTFCMAFGINPGVTVWDGTRWTPASTPWPRSTGELGPALSCASPRSCLAAESQGDVLAHWDGAGWAAVSGVPLVAYTGIACLADRDCLLIDAQQTRRWRDGTVTRLGDGPPPSGDPDLWCASPTECLMVGNRFSSPTDRFGLAARWDGTAWHDETPPDALGFYSVNDLDCVSVQDCVVAGSATGSPTNRERPRILRWTPTGWTSIDTTGSAMGKPSSVACATEDACFVGGLDHPNSQTSNSIVRIEGARAVPTESPKAVRAEAMACPGPRRCLAVGQGDRIEEIERVFPRVLDWEGETWRRSTTFPYPTEVSGSDLRRVACATPTACVAVGRDSYNGVGPVGAWYARRWDGTRWTPVNDPDLPGQWGRLEAVACASAQFCVLAGSRTDADGRSVPAVWVGDNGDWSAAQVAGGAPGRALTGVSCPTPQFCLAVGPDRVLRWDGRGWTEVAPPPVPTAGPPPLAHEKNGARAVSCWAVDSCAVTTLYLRLGEREPRRGAVDRWDGRGWTRRWQSWGEAFDQPAPGLVHQVGLVDVSCAVEERCVAAGWEEVTLTATSTLVRGSGTSWAKENGPFGPMNFSSVSCLPDSTCAVIGRRPPDHGGEGAPMYAVSRRGGPWSIQGQTPALELAALSCSAGACIAVGGSGTATAARLRL